MSATSSQGSLRCPFWFCPESCRSLWESFWCVTLLIWLMDSGTSTPSWVWPWRLKSENSLGEINQWVCPIVNIRVLFIDKLLFYFWISKLEYYLLGLKTICLGCWVSADPRTQPFSCPQSWDHLGPRHGTAACSPLRCLAWDNSRYRSHRSKQKHEVKD